MKKSIAIIMVGILMMSLMGCSAKSGHDAYKEIYKRFNDFESYYAEAVITARNDRSENVYHVRQFYKAPDMYSMVVDGPEAVAGSGYVFKNGEVILKSGFGKSEVLSIASPTERSYFCVADFFEEYYKSEETAVATSGGVFNGETTVMSCQISGKNPNMFSQKLWIDNKTFLPLKLETYDVNNRVVMTVEYNDFKRNCDIEDTFFE